VQRGEVCARADWDAMSAGTSTATADNAKIFCFISLEPLIFFVARVLAYALRPHVIGKKNTIVTSGADNFLFGKLSDPTAR